VKVLQTVLKMMSKGTQIYYITGNHDELLRKYSGMCLGNFTLDDKLVLELDGKKHWFFHGDVFDITMRHSKWLAKLGGSGYDILILINRFINKLLQRLGKEKISLSKRVKDSVKLAVKHINNFEQTAAEIAIDNGYDYVVLGHIHEPVAKTFVNGKGMVHYLNSGDWIENLTALEYNNSEWKLVHYREVNQEVETDFVFEENQNAVKEFEQLQSIFISKVFTTNVRS
jgi:UDP-2,3-diacylglucosamine pyrophosphatase LpxH